MLYSVKDFTVKFRFIGFTVKFTVKFTRPLPRASRIAFTVGVLVGEQTLEEGARSARALGCKSGSGSVFFADEFTC
jgi:hypothetical protein